MQGSWRWVFALTLFACWQAVAVPAALAGGFHITTIGGSRTGMTTNLARPNDGTALFHNPAGLADQRGVRAHLSISVPLMRMDLRLRALDRGRFPAINPEGCEQQPGGCPWPTDSEGYYTRSITPDRIFGLLPFASVSTDLSFLWPAREDMVVALGVYAPNFMGAFLPSEAPSAYLLIDGMFLVITTSAGWSWRVNRHVAVGLAMSYNNMRLTMSQKMSTLNTLSPRGGPPTFIGRMGQQALGDLRMDFEGHDHGLGWEMGVLLSPVEMLTFGLTYAGNTTAHFRGEVQITPLGATEPGIMDSLLKTFHYKLPTSLIVEVAIPHAFGAGVLLRPAPWLDVAFDCRFWLYNLVRTQSIVPLYEPGKGNEPMTEESLSKTKNYHFTYQLSLGVAVRPWEAIDVEFMAGLSFDMSPVPDATFSLDNPSMNLLAPAVGVRWVMFEHWRVALSYQVLFYLERDITNSITRPPTNVQGSGLNHMPGLEVEYLF